MSFKVVRLAHAGKRNRYLAATGIAFIGYVLFLSSALWFPGQKKSMEYTPLGIQQDINKIALDLRKAHKDDFFSVPEDNPLEDFLQTAEEAASPNSDPEQAAMAFICKRLKLNYGKLSEEEKKWLKRIAQKSDLLKNPNPQRGRK